VISLPRCELRRGVPTALAPLVDATSGSAPRLATRVTLEDAGSALRIRFECEDPDPWATLAERDGDLWTEEVVEVFLAAGEETPKAYFELELNPLGTLFDARVIGPHGDRSAMTVDRSWRAAGLTTAVEIDPAGRWRAELTIPWRTIGDGEERWWRCNFFRIDRPRTPNSLAAPEFSAWSPTCMSPADFHRPARFGILQRIG
jgi:hypothetical protein